MRHLLSCCTRSAWVKQNDWEKRGLHAKGRVIFTGKDRCHFALNESDGEAAFLRDGWRVIEVFVITREIRGGEWDEPRDRQKRDRAKEQGEGTWRKIDRSSEGVMMTKWQEDDRDMGHVYPQEEEAGSGGKECRQNWWQQTEGSLCLRGRDGCVEGGERWRKTAPDGEKLWKEKRLMKLNWEAVSEGKWEDMHLKIIGEKEK